MLKIEDLKVGDELEYINGRPRQEFSCIDGGDHKLTQICNLYIKDLSGGRVHVVYKCNTVFIYNDELKYFRKVETNKEVVDTEEVVNTLVNAGIKSAKEMYTRLLDGEVFYFDDEKYIFEDGYFYTRYKEGGVDPYVNMLEKFTEFQVKKPWYEFASEENPILCKVWNTDPDDFKYDHVEGKDALSFLSKCNGHVRYATPVKPSECFQGG